MKKVFKFLAYTLLVLMAGLLAWVVDLTARFNPDDFKARLQAYVFERTHRTLVLPEKIHLSFFPGVGIRLEHVSLSEPGSRTPFASADVLQAGIALWPLVRRELRFDEVHISGLTARIARTASGEFNFSDLLGLEHPQLAPGPVGPHSAVQDIATASPDDTSTLSTISRLPEEIDIRSLRIDNARLFIRDPAIPRDVEVDDLTLYAGPLAQGEAATVRMEARVIGFDPSTALVLSARSRLTPDIEGRGVKLEQFHGELTGEHGVLEAADAQLGADRAEISAGQLQAQGLTFELRLPDPHGNVAHLVLKGQAVANLSGKDAQWDLTGQFDDTALALQGSIEYSSEPTVSLHVRIADLDLDRYLPVAAQAPSSAQHAAPSQPMESRSASVQAAADTTVDLSFLQHKTLRGDIEISHLKALGLRTGSVRLQARLQDGLAELKPFTAVLYGGGVFGSLLVDSNTDQSIAAHLDLRKVHVAALTQDLMGQHPLDGQGNVALDLHTSGRTLGTLRQNLNGTVGAQLSDGAIQGFDVAGSVRALQNRIAGLPQPPPSARPKTDFTDFQASVHIVNGVARNEDLRAKTPLLRLSGRGVVDLVQETLDYTFIATLVPSLEGQGATDPVQLQGMVLPLRLVGPFDNIRARMAAPGSSDYPTESPAARSTP